MKKVIVFRKGEKVKTTALEGIRFDLLLKTDVLAAELCTFEPGASLAPTCMHPFAFNFDTSRSMFLTSPS